MNIIAFCISTIIMLLVIWIPVYPSNLKIFLTIVCTFKLLVKHDTTKSFQGLYGGKIYNFLDKHIKHKTSELLVDFIQLILSVFFELVTLLTDNGFMIIVGLVSVVAGFINVFQDIREVLFNRKD